MPIFYLKFLVTPTASNENYELVKGAFASCWVEEHDEQGAYTKASFFVSKDDWEIRNIDLLPIEVEENDFIGKDIGTEYFNKAKKNGVAICYVGWSRNGISTIPITPTTPSYKFDVGSFIKFQKKFENTGRCLHHDCDGNCKQIVNAHSIQKNQALSVIADEGHVYMLSTDYTSIKKNIGKPSFRKIGINNASTFLGFCKKHDNELFEPIDNFLLIPTDQQVMLYAYRSLCRELFVKKNAVDVYGEQRKEKEAPQWLRDLFDGSYHGSRFGLNNLQRYKDLYDNSLKSRSYHNISYVLFSSAQKPELVFSGLLFPDFDFMGRQLQNLANYAQDLELITFCSAPTEDGWGYLFAWYNSNRNICEAFMRSLATRMHDGENLGDMLFRLAILSCENLAISPKWWEALPSEHSEKIIAAISPITSPFTSIKQSYLYDGLERIINWEFESVISKME